MITKKQYAVFKSLDDDPEKSKKVKKTSYKSGTSLSHTYKCLKALKKGSHILQTGVKPKEFIRVGRLYEPVKQKKKR